MNLLDVATDPRTLTLAVALVTLGLFVWNRLRLDVVALIAMTSLMLLGVVTPAQGISGFANEAVITVAAMLAMSAGLLRTGAVDDLGRWIQRASGKSEFRLLLIVVAVVIPVSALINNTAAVAVLLPVVVGVSRSMDVAPSRVLMPLSFAGQMGGTLTLVGTSTNLLVAGLVLDLGMDRIGLFEITPPAAILALAGAAYLLTLGRWLTPERESPRDLVDAYDLRKYLGSFRVLESSRLAESTLAESRLGEREGILVVGIRRGKRNIRGIGGATKILAGDELLVEGSVSDVARFTEKEGLEVATEEPVWDFPPSRPMGPGGPVGPGDETPGSREGAQVGTDRGNKDEKADEKDGRILAELLVQPRAFADQQPLGLLALNSRWGITVLGLQRRGRPLRRALAKTPLKAGDLLLVEGTAEQLQAIHKGGDFSLLGSVEVPARRRHLRWVAIGILLAVVGLPAVGVLPIVVTATTGVVVMFLTGCLTPQEAYVEMDWMVLVLLSAILPLGIAMQETGTAELLVSVALSPVGDVSPLIVLAAFYVMTSLLTEAISNNAAAVVMTPLAVASAATLGFSPLPLVVAVMFAASNSFLTPIGYQTNTFIYGPGGYRVLDFVRVGGPLSLLLLAISTVVIPIFFPF